MSTGKRPSFPTSGRGGYASKKLAPMIEVVERRELLATGFGVIAGTAFLDANKDNTLDATDAYLPGATVQLYQQGSATLLASQVTNAQGGYSFTGLAPGTYNVIETPPQGYQATGNQILSQVETGSTLGSNEMQVTVPAGPVFLNYNGVLPGSYQVLNDQVNGTATTDSVGLLQVSLGTSAGATNINAGFVTDCLNDLDRLSFAGGEQFQVVPTSITNLTNGTSTISAANAGQIAFLFNHFGNSSLNNIQAPALQLAIWELLYDTGPPPNFSAGNFQVLSPDTTFTSQATLDQVLAQATVYYDMSIGKSEAAILLNANFASSAPLDGVQSMIAQNSFNFANQTVAPATPASLAGFVYCDANHDGVKDAGDMAIAGATVTLTGTDQTGLAVSRTTTTDATGAYSFSSLVAGTYTLKVTSTPLGFVPATDNQGTPGNGQVLTNEFANITLAGGVNGVNNNFGFTGQAVSVTNLQLLGIHQQQSQIVLQFNGPLNAAAATNPANYDLTGLGKDEIYGTRDDVHYSVKATYNPTNNTVTLIPNQHLNIHYHYVLQLNLPGVNGCAQPVSYTNVFGRTAVPYFNVHGVIKPNPPLTAQEIHHNAAVVARTLAKLAR